MTTAERHEERFWMCPACGEDLEAGDALVCPICKKGPAQEGRLLDFQEMTPDMHLGLAGILAEVHHRIAGKYPDASETWRVRHSLGEIGHVSQGGSVLEIGGANGPMTKRLELLFDRVVSIDHSPSFVRCVCANTQRTICVIGDALHTPLRANCVDFVICTEVLEHVIAPTQLLLESRRVLKPNGLLYLTVPNCLPILNPFRLMRKTLLDARETHVNFYDIVSLQHVLTRSGFEIRRIRTLRNTKALLRTAWRNPLNLRGLLPAWGSIIECVAGPLPDPIPYWQNYVSRHT